MMNTRAMCRRLPFLAVLAGALAWTPSALAQLEWGLTEPKWVEGKVADFEPAGSMVTMLRLDDGTRISVPLSSKAPGSEVRVGAQVSARYVDTPSGKIAVFLRVEGDVQAP